MKAFRLFSIALLLLLSAQSIFAGRYYDSKTGRFLSVDPKADKFPGISPYNYCINNPLNNIDPNGKEPLTITAGGIAAGAALIAFTGHLYNYSTNASYRRNYDSFVSSAISVTTGTVKNTFDSILNLLSGGEAISNDNIDSDGQSSDKESVDSKSKANAQDKKLTKGEIKALEDGKVDVHELKGGKKTGKTDLYKDKDGNIKIKGKGGKGPGEETGHNINDFIKK